MTPQHWYRTTSSRYVKLVISRSASTYVFGSVTIYYKRSKKLGLTTFLWAVLESQKELWELPVLDSIAIESDMMKIECAAGILRFIGVCRGILLKTVG